MRCEIDRANDTTLDNALWPPQHRCPLLIGTKAVPPIEPHWFKERLAALKMSQRQLAVRLSLDHAAVSLMLRGKRQNVGELLGLIHRHLTLAAQHQ